MNELMIEPGALFLLREVQGYSEADIAIHHSHNIFTLAHTVSSLLSHLRRRLLPCPLAQPTYPKLLVRGQEETV